MIIDCITSRLFTIGTFFAFSASLLSDAHGFECDVGAQKPEPSWVAQMGTNSDLETVYGYAQTRPLSGSPLTQVLQILKSNAMADLALNIRSDVTSNISTEMNFDGDDASDKTQIKAASQSSLSFGALGDTQIFIDNLACMVFTRVGLTRTDIPYVLALSDFRRFEASVKTTNLTMLQLDELSQILKALQNAAKLGRPVIQQQYLALEPEINKVTAITNEKLIGLMAAQLDGLTGTPKEKREFLQRLSTLLSIKNKKMTVSDLEIKKAVDKSLAALDSVVGSKLMAVSWKAQSVSINSNLEAYFANASETFWLAGTLDDPTKLLNLSSQYDLSSALFFDISTNTSRQFGIDEVAINVELLYYDNGEPQRDKSKILSGKAIGRPINDTIISQKIINLIDAAL